LLRKLRLGKPRATPKCRIPSNSDLAVKNLYCLQRWKAGYCLRRIFEVGLRPRIREEASVTMNACGGRREPRRKR